MATKIDPVQIKKTLDKKLVKLQGESAFVQSVVAKTNQLEYENLAGIYIWWRAASSVEDYLVNAYKVTLERRVKNEFDSGLNFRRLLYLMYGNYGIGKDSLDRKDLALSNLHVEFEKNSELYAKDSVTKLAGFIKAQGGVDGLIYQEKKQISNTSLQQAQPSSQPANVLPSQGSQSQSQGSVTKGPQSQSQSSTSQVSQRQRISSAPKNKLRIEVVINDGMRQTALLVEAAVYYSKNKTHHQFSITPPISTNKDGFGLALIKRNDSGYEVIGTTDNTNAVREILVSAYRKQYAAMPDSMRCFLEIIKTQSLPSNLQKLYDKLAELSFQKHEDRTRKRISRRVMYVASENMLVLSPTFSSSGVVTLAKLKLVPFEGDVSDCFMPPRCRKLVEQRLLATYDFNLFAPRNHSQAPKFNHGGLASHMLRLDNKAHSGDFVFLEFWPFETEMGNAANQLFFASSYIKNCKIQFKLPPQDFQTLAFDHINNWLASYGDHITRPANQLVEMSFDSVGFVLGFDFVNGVFRNHASCAFTNALAKSLNYKATFLSRDLFLALHSIGELQLIGDVGVACSNDSLILSYATEVADYTVVVPTTDGLKRNDAAFCIYSPVTKAAETVVYASEDEIFDDLLLEQASSTSIVPLTDDEIDRLIGIEPDDYSEIMESIFDQAYDEAEDVEWTTSAEQQ